MTQWQNKRIRQLGRVVTGKTPPKNESRYFAGEELFISPKDLNENQLYVIRTQTQVSPEALEKFRNQVVSENSVMFTSLSFGFGKMGIASRPCLTNQQINSVIVNKDNDFRFVYYLLKACTPFIFAYNSGIDTPIVPKSVFQDIELKCPNRRLQSKIAAILWAYDLLIESNKRRMALLERLADEIYREWFVRFRFPGYKAVKLQEGTPEGWERKPLLELADITYGFPFDGSRFNSAGRGRPIIRIRNIPDSSTTDYTEEETKEKYIVHTGELLIGMDGEFHINHWYGDEAYLVQRVCRLKAKNPHVEGYLAQAIRAPIKHFESILMGATVGHLGAVHLRSILLTVPPKHMHQTLGIFNQIHRQKILLARATSALSKTRDQLLPRLISGKLSVDNIDIQFPPSMAEELEAEQALGTHA